MALKQSSSRLEAYLKLVSNNHEVVMSLAIKFKKNNITSKFISPACRFNISIFLSFFFPWKYKIKHFSQILFSDINRVCTNKNTFLTCPQKVRFFNDINFYGYVTRWPKINIPLFDVSGGTWVFAKQLKDTFLSSQ